MSLKRELFYSKLISLKCDINDSYFTKERYIKVLEELRDAQNLKKEEKPLTSKQYRRLKRFDILKLGDMEKLIAHCESGSTTESQEIRYVCTAEELFDVLETAHVSVGHKRTRGKSSSFCTSSAERLFLKTYLQ